MTDPIIPPASEILAKLSVASDGATAAAAAGKNIIFQPRKLISFSPLGPSPPGGASILAGKKLERKKQNEKLSR